MCDAYCICAGEQNLFHNTNAVVSAPHTAQATAYLLCPLATIISSGTQASN